MQPQGENFPIERQQQPTAQREVLKPATPSDQLTDLASEGKKLTPETQRRLQQELGRATEELSGNLNQQSSLESQAARRLTEGVTRIAGAECGETIQTVSRGADLQEAAKGLERGEVPLSEVIARVSVIEAEVLTNQFKHMGAKACAQSLGKARPA